LTRWIVEKIPSDANRFMIHRQLDEAQAFGENGAAISLSLEILNSIAGIKEPSKFIIDGYLDQEGLYRIFDILWWENTELYDSPLEHRKGFLSKWPETSHIKILPYYRCNDISEIKNAIVELGSCETDQIYLIRRAEGFYPLDGKAEDWHYFQCPRMMASAGSDKRIQELVDSGKWPELKAEERFELMIQRRSLEPLYPFAPLKTSKKGYRIQELWTLTGVRGLMQEWFEGPATVAVEVKFDGFRVVIHKKGGEVRIDTESGDDISKNLPNLSADVKTLMCESCILDSELVPYDEEGKALGRRKGAEARGSKVIDDSYWTAHIFDLLYLNGKDLHREPYSRRRELLKGLELPAVDLPKIPPKPKFHLHENSVHLAKNVNQALRFAGEVTKVKYSEGAMFKLWDGDYPLNGTTLTWAKMKKSFEIDCILLAKFPAVHKTGPEKGKPIEGNYVWLAGIGPLDESQIPEDGKAHKIS